MCFMKLAACVPHFLSPATTLFLHPITAHYGIFEHNACLIASCTHAGLVYSELIENPKYFRLLAVV